MSSSRASCSTPYDFKNSFLSSRDMPAISSSSLAFTKIAWPPPPTRLRNFSCKSLSVRPDSSTLNMYMTGLSVKNGMFSSEGSFLRLAAILASVSSSANCSSRLMMSISSLA